MREAALMVVSVIGLAIATPTSLEAQGVVENRPLHVLVQGQPDSYLGEGVRLMTIYSEEWNAAVWFLGFTDLGDMGYVWVLPR